jgi:hypothetical protein
MTVVRLRGMTFKKILQERTGSSSMGRRGKVQRAGGARDIRMPGGRIVVDVM